ncbi:unnamed protein product [Mytilus coruscus]|uniref:Trans-Golgi network integral membrane protein 2 n=1 Tax=Mytilus coruscus TaxID=42192 RepID=A0A6J8B4C4_MYTCO|nr:unnamed protein product [Mytilus coruscus]
MMAMQENRNISLIWMFIFVCLQCLVVKSLPISTSTAVSINHTVHSQTDKGSGTLVDPTAMTTQNITPNDTNNESNENVNTHNKTTVNTLIDNKTSNGQANKISTLWIGTTNTTVSPTSQTPTLTKSLETKTTNSTVSPTSQTPTITKTTTDVNKSPASPKNDITESPTSKNHDESPKNKTPESTTNKNPDESLKNKTPESTTNKNPDESLKNKTPESTTNKNPDELTNKNLPPNSATSKKPTGSGGQNELSTTKKPNKTQDQSVINKSTTTKKPTESPDQNVQNKIPGSKISLDTGETNDGKKDENKKPMNSGTLYEDDEDSGGHFMAYFITFVVICIAGYIIYHNKQKILAFILEGKKDGSRRRPNSKEYKRLKTDEVMPSLEKNTSDNKYIY